MSSLEISNWSEVSTPVLQALECLVRLASVRRSLFTNDAARSKFLAHLMTGTKEILQTGQGSICLLGLIICLNIALCMMKFITMVIANYYGEIFCCMTCYAFMTSLLHFWFKKFVDLVLGLADHDNYHEFCRLLGRFRVNYQVLYLLAASLLWCYPHFTFSSFSMNMCYRRVCTW